MTWFIISTVSIVAGAAWIVVPLLTRAREATPTNKSHELLEQRMAIYRSMLDLELDHSTGKVSDEDLVTMRSEHESEALELLRRDSDNEPLEPDLLEVEIAEARRRLAGGR